MGKKQISVGKAQSFPEQSTGLTESLSQVSVSPLAPCMDSPIIHPVCSSQTESSPYSCAMLTKATTFQAENQTNSFQFNMKCLISFSHYLTFFFYAKEKKQRERGGEKGRTMVSTKPQHLGSREANELPGCGHRLPKKCLNFEPNQGV